MTSGRWRLRNSRGNQASTFGLRAVFGAVLILLPAMVRAADDASPPEGFPAVPPTPPAAAPASPAPAETAPVADPPAPPPVEGTVPPATGAAVSPESKPAAQAAKPASANAPPAPTVVPWSPVGQFAARIGYWEVMTSGSPVRIGQYQDLESSPFWDADGIFSDGNNTADVTISGTDNESTHGRLKIYSSPHFSGVIDYQRFPYRFAPRNFRGFDASPALDVNTNNATYTDNNVGEDYALRVQELKAGFKGYLTKDLKWRLNVFGMEKSGNRQANSLAHCYTAQLAAGGSQAECHVVSNSQRIDWKTTQVEPGIEFRVGPRLTLEYSHLTRIFQQQDAVVTNDFTADSSGYGFPDPANPNPGATGIAAYAIVPDSTTNINRAKVRAQLEHDTDVYAMGFIGDTDNRLRQITQHFSGVDLRLTNTSFAGLALTVFGKYYAEDTDQASTPLDTLYPAMASLYQEPTVAGVVVPVNRTRDAVGVDLRWRPFHAEQELLRNSMVFVFGYEHSELRRSNATYPIVGPTSGTFVQPSTNANTFTIGVEQKWSPYFASFARYKRIDSYYPLIGVTAAAYGGVDAPDAILNTALPTEENRLEIGGTWTPTDCLAVNGTFYVENATNHGPYTQFDSNSFPFTISGWYSPTPDWSFSVGYADFMDWITQNVTLGATGGDSRGVPEPSFTSPWHYSGKSDVFSLGTRYAWTKELHLNGDFEYMNGLNTVSVTPTPGGAVSYSNPPNPYLSVGDYSLVSVRTFRLAAGVDYLVAPRVTTYFRYNYFDFADLATGLATGQSHMVLGGVNAIF